MNIAILGAGMIGRTIARDLAKNHKVTAFDVDAHTLDLLKEYDENIEIVGADLALFGEYENWFAPFDILVTAVPGNIGYKTLEAVINAGKNVVDISFFPEEAMQLNALAQQKGVTAIIDCGVAPGLSNLILGRYNEEMQITSFECFVGGLPKERKPPFEYKAPFSPIDVIQEYIRPARMIENGEVVTKAPLSDREIISFEEVGELEAFNTDGLRSLLVTMRHIPVLKEKTMRYPGHAALINAMQEGGFFDTTPLRFDEVDVTPLEFTSRLLVHHWKLDPAEEEFTIMKVVMKGTDKTISYLVYDEYDLNSKTSSMSRTTGFTCAAAVNLLANKIFNGEGIFPPELIGRDKKCFDFVMQYLAERNVSVKKSEDI